MNTLNAYISSIDPILLNHITGKPRVFIDLYRSRKFASEEAFISLICDTGNAPTKTRKYYFLLKARVIKILQSLLLISDFGGAKKNQKKLDLLRKNFAVGMKFISKGENEEGIKVIKQAHDLAVEYGVSYFACETASILMRDHIYYNRNNKKAKYYADCVEKYARNYIAEKYAEVELYWVINKMNGNSKKIDFKDVLSKVSQRPGDSLKYHNFLSMIKVYKSMDEGDYHHVITICTQTLSYFKGKPGVFSSHRHFFLMNRSICQIGTGDYQNAKKDLLQIEEETKSTSFNNYLSRLYQTINAFHDQDYIAAYDLYKQNRKCRFEVIREQFAIMEAYVSILSENGFLQLPNRFRMSKYLNEVFVNGKSRDNINILIAELVFYLMKDRGKFVDKMEAVKTYAHKYLRAKDMARANRFFKILCMLPAVNFHPVALQRKAATHIQFLKNNPIRTGQNISIEIIPFEVLLEMILQKLAKKVA